jgi:hypothetical protein
MVTDQLGHDPFRPDADQEVSISIAKADVGFRARIVWTEPDGRPAGERALSSRSRDCHEIAANVAFAVALQLQLVERGVSPDGNADGTDRPPPTTTEQENRAPPIPERPAVPAPAPAGSGRASAARVVLAVGAGPAVGVGMTPGATAFGRLFVAARLGWFSGEIAADAGIPSTQREPDGTGVAVTALGSSAAGCAHVAVVSVCLLGRLGWIRARGVDIAAPSTSWGRFGEVGMRLALTREIGRVIVAVHADGLVMLSRWNVVLNDSVVWTAPRVGAVAGVDLALRFF